MKKNSSIIHPIEWMRAFAVVAVTIYHMDKHFLPGGYLGVDIFLVISGYLVGGALVKKDSFNLSEFFNFMCKRVWRLYPALIIAIILSFAFSYLYSTPGEMNDFGRNSLASYLGMSNILFWKESGYFAGSSEFNFLLHTWSLSLEWQYYIGFAVILLILHKVIPKRNRSVTINIVLVVGLLITFAFSLYGSKNHPTANFYLIFTRLWEFFFGTIVYILSNRKYIKNNTLKLSLLSAGVLGCLYSVIFLDESLSLPGFLTLLPVIATSFFLLGSDINISEKVKTVFILPLEIGKVSYSVYLLHWPILVAYKEVIVSSPLNIVIYIFVLYFLSKIVYHCVEIRCSNFYRPNRKILTLVLFLIPFILLVISSYFIHKNNGFDSRFTSDELNYLSESKKFNDDRTYCLNKDSVNHSNPINKRCSDISTKGKKFNVLIWGDSHLEALRGPMLKNGVFSQFNVDFLGMAGCPPLPDVDREFGKKRCGSYATKALSYAKLNASKYDLIIYGARFTAYVNGNTGYLGSAEGGPHQYMVDSMGLVKNRMELFKDRVEKVASVLASIEAKVVFIGSIPEYGKTIPRAAFKSFVNSGNAEVKIDRDLVNDRSNEIDNVLNMTSKVNGLLFFDPKTVFCDDEYCTAAKNDSVYYFDDDHLNINGSTLLLTNLFKDNLFITE